MDITFFVSPDELRAWLTNNRQTVPGLYMGFYRENSGFGGITYAEALDEALCFGWIDGVRRKIDDVSFNIRFTPRKVGSIWSLINVKHVEGLLAGKRMTASGTQEKKFRRHKRAWNFWKAQPPGYKRVAIHCVASAKQEATRARRLTQLIADSAGGLRPGQVTGDRGKG